MSDEDARPVVLPGEDGEPPSLDLDAAEPLLRHLELLVGRRIDGLLQGNYLGLLPGPGSEAGESRPYVPGDDVRRMDWPVTARTTVPHVRQTVADRELETWLAVDMSPSLDFGTALTEKRQLALAAITTVVHLTARGGNRVGAVVGNGSDSYQIPALSGVAHARHLVRRIAATPRAADAGSGNLTALLERLRRPPRRRGLVAVVSDFLDSDAVRTAPSWERALRGLSDRHQLLAVEILDPRELELPAAGLVTFTDPETGRQLEVQTSDRRVRVRYAQAAAEQRAAIRGAIVHARAAHLQLRTDRDWLTDVVRFVHAQRHGGGPRSRPTWAAVN